MAKFQEVQAVVAANQAVCVVFAEADRYYQRPGIAYLPIRDAPLGRWALVWRTAATPLVHAFADAARDLDRAAGPSTTTASGRHDPPPA